jgi:hypothetical protein
MAAALEYPEPVSFVYLMRYVFTVRYVSLV